MKLNLIVVFSCSFLFLHALPLHAASQKPIMDALEHYLSSINRRKNAQYSTRQNDFGEYVIGSWDVPGVRQPTEEELDQLVLDYENHVIDEKERLEQKRAAAEAKLTELGLDLEGLREALRG